MANKQIYELTTRTFDGDSLIPISVENTDPSTQAQYPQLAGKTTGNDVSDFVANTQQYSTDLDTEAKTITGAINELHSSIGADAYDDTATYAVGDLCIHNNTLYKCTTAITVAEAWNASHWTATSIADEINGLKSALSEITLNSNPATGDYHFDLAQGWSVTNFVFNRVGNRIYMQGVFVKNSAFTSYETFISLSASSTKIISPYYETWFATMCDDGNGGSVSCERLQAVYGSLRIASGNSNHRRIFVCASWISSSDVV